MYGLLECHVMIERGGRISASTFLISAINGSKWSASRPGHFTLEGATCIHWIEILLCPRAGLDAVEQKKKILSLPEI
jgi:hypothetical protein